jgi:1,4-alpha-glucan branching enzyme/maltooligosyltrehalose trehalohydrolase
MPFGAALKGGGAQFRLWAPAAASAAVVLQPGGDEETTLEATREDRGWYRATLERADAGLRYLWLIDGKHRVPDPASRFNPLGPHGPSELVDASDFEWDTQWRARPWHEAVFYELHVGCFTPAGTYNSAASQLAGLAELGVTALQLMPLGDWPGRFGWGYDGVLPFAPHAAYGTPSQLKRLIQAAHRLRMMVFVDVVYNHFGPDGNYLGRYAPQFFSTRHKTAWGAAINFDGEDSDIVREFFVHNALYWVNEFHVDGLRLDAVHAMVDDRRPDILEELSQRVREAAGARRVHLVLENDSNDASRLAAPGTPGRYDGQWNGDFHHTLHVQLTRERDGYYAEYDAPVDQLARVLTHGFAREGGPHRAEGEPQAVENAHPRRAAQSSVPLSATVNFLQNHDQIGNRAFGERMATLVADAAALRLASAICLLGVSPPMLFMGEEFASTSPFLYFADWSGELRDAVRRGRLEEFKHFPRYALAAERGEIADPCSESTFRRCKLERASVHSAQHREWRRFCSDLLTVRRRLVMPHLAKLASGGHRAWRLGENGLAVRWLFTDERVFEMLVNLGRTPLRLLRDEMPPALSHSSLVFSLGAASADSLGGNAGLWHWGEA